MSERQTNILCDKMCNLYEQSLQAIKETQKLYNNITDIAINVERDEYSWAVICIAGKPENERKNYISQKKSKI